MLRAGRRTVHSVMIRRSVKPCNEIRDLSGLAERAGVRVTAVDQRDLNRAAGSGNHQGVAAEVSEYPTVAFDELCAGLDSPAEDPLLLMLDHIQDPRNLGALLRVADATGVHGVILPAHRASGVTPVAARTSSGAAEHLKVCVVTNLVRSMKVLKKAGLWFAGLDAVEQAQVYSEAELDGPLALVVGSEGEGLGRMVSRTCDFLVKLPLQGRVGSLNAAVAGAIALYEIRRQRGMKTGREE